MRKSAWLLVLLAMLVPVAAHAQVEPSRREVGTVTAAGKPVFHALVQLLPAGGGPPVQEAWTDASGTFVLTAVLDAGQTLRAQRTVQDATGDSHRLVATAVSPLRRDVRTNRNLALTLEENGVRTRPVPLATLEAWMAASAGPSVATGNELAAHFDAVMQAPDAAARKALFLKHATALRSGDDRWFEAWFENESQRLQTLHAPSQMVRVGDVLVEMAQTYALPWMECDGHLMRAVGHFHAGHMADAAQAADLAVQAQHLAVQQEPRPGWQRTRKKGLDTALVIDSLAHYLAKDGPGGAKVREQALALETALGLDLEAATSLHFLGDCAVLANDAAQAQARYRQAADLAGKAEAWPQQGRSLLALAAQLPPLQAIPVLQQATQVLEKAGQRLDAAKARSQWGRHLVQVQKYAEAVAVLTPAIDVLKTAGQPKELALALGGLGRGEAHYALQHFDLGARDLEQAEALDAAAGRNDARALDLQTWGYCLSGLGKHADARAKLLRSAELYLGLDESFARLGIDVLGQAAQTFDDDEAHPDPHSALELYDRAIGLAREHHLPDLEADLLQFAGYLCFFAGQDVAGLEDRAWLDKAVAYLEKAGTLHASLDPGKARQALSHLATTRRFLAVALATQGHVDEAVATLRQSIEGSQAAGEAQDAMASRDALGLLLFEHARFADAAVEWRQFADWLGTPAGHAPPSQATLDLAKKNPNARVLLQPDRRRATTLSMLATAHWNRGDPAATLRTLEVEGQVLRDLHDAGAVFDVEREATLYRFLAGDGPGFDKGLAQVQTAADTPDRQAAAQALALLATVRLPDPAQRLAKVHEVLAWLHPRLAQARKLDASKRAGFAQAWTLAGTLLGRSGQPREGIQALQVAAELTDPRARVALLGEIARTHQALGELQQALDAQRQVLAAHKTLELFTRPAEQLQTLLEMLEIQRALGNPTAATATLQEAVRLAGKVEQQPRLLVPDRKALGDLWTVLGRGAFTAGNVAGAHEALGRALQQYQRTGQDARVAEARLLHVLARQQLQKGPRLQEELLEALDLALRTHAFEPLLLGLTGLDDRAARLQWLDRAQKQAVEQGALAVLPYLAFGRATELRDLHRGDEALAAYREAIAALERVRSSLQSDQSKVGFLDVHDDAFYGAPLDLLLGRGQGGEALELSEQMRGRAMLDVLASGQLRRSLGQQGRASLQALADRLQAAARQDEALSVANVAGLTVQTVDPVTGQAKAVAPTRTEVKLAGGQKAAQVQKLLADLDERRRQMARSDSEVTSLVTAPAPTLAELQQLVKQRGATAVEYDVGATHLTALVLKPDGTVVVRRQPLERAALEALVTQTRQALGVAVGRGAEAFEAPQPEQKDAAARALETLGQVLVAPIADVLPQDPEAEVLIVPHRSLFLVPFAALPDRGQPWVARHALAVVPSLAVLRYTGRKGRAAGQEALVVGNPLMPPFGGGLPALPGAEREAQEVAASLATQGLKVQTLTGGHATEAAVQAAMARAQIVHLATHGVVRDDAVGKSFVALAPGSGADGMLTVDEVMGLKLQAKLVTLSACQTGLGRVSGDGVLGMGRAFLYAGTPSVVVSLWSVSDEATSFEMGRLYFHLQKGLGVARALRRAMMETKDRWSSVAEWAAFEVFGEGFAIP